MVDEALARELIDMTDEDRRLQAGALGDGLSAQSAHRRVTTRNGDRFAAILDEHGWPTAELAGSEAARRARLVAQHADRQLDLQRLSLKLMGDAVHVAKHAPA
jgi:hypothetical protein